MAEQRITPRSGDYNQWYQDVIAQAELAEAVCLARAKGARLVVDDAGGARVGPAVFGQPRSLEQARPVIGFFLAVRRKIKRSRFLSAITK